MDKPKSQQNVDAFEAYSSGAEMPKPGPKQTEIPKPAELGTEPAPREIGTQKGENTSGPSEFKIDPTRRTERVVYKNDWLTPLVILATITLVVIAFFASERRREPIKAPSPKKAVKKEISRPDKTIETYKADNKMLRAKLKKLQGSNNWLRHLLRVEKENNGTTEARIANLIEQIRQAENRPAPGYWLRIRRYYMSKAAQ